MSADADIPQSPAESRFIAFFDECGDHSLEKRDDGFPLFVLSTVIVERKDYAERIIPALARLKLEFWEHEGINLHSREIRKATGPYAFLQVPPKRERFLRAMSEFMAEAPFTLFITCIRKDAYAARYGATASNPYDLSLEYTFERVWHFLDGFGETHLPVVAESRGKQEDASLGAAFYRLMTHGTAHHPAAEFQKLRCPITFRSKLTNIAGIQLADLCAHPCARHVLKPEQPNHAFEIVRKHLYQRGDVSGWKVHPKENE